MEPFIGAIIMFGGNFAPRGWALCDGALLQISSNQALFSILGTTYGGDGRTTFGLPDLRGRVPVHEGSGPGLTPRRLGEKSGQETTTLSVNHMPSHTHTISGSVNVGVTDEDGTTNEANGSILANTVNNNYKAGASNGQLAGVSHQLVNASTGGGLAFSNMQPYQCVNFIIALLGTYPSRN